MENEQIEFYFLASGSSGNSYIFKKHNELVMVECGLEHTELVDKMFKQNIDASKVKSVIVTHSHNDHCLALDNYARYGKKIYCPSTCLSKLTKQDSPNINIMSDGKEFQITSWLKMKCFATCHDTESYGFIFLDTETKESVLFINDTKCFDFKYKNVKFDYVFIECNHIRKQLEVVMQTKLDKGENVYKYKRQAEYHLSLAGCKKFLMNMNLSKTKALFLMHLSKELANPTTIKAEIKETFGITTYVCLKEGGIF